MYHGHSGREHSLIDVHFASKTHSTFTTYSPQVWNSKKKYSSINKEWNNNVNQFSTHVFYWCRLLIDQTICPFVLTPETIAVESRRPLVIERFIDLPIVIGWWPEVGGALELGQRSRDSLRLHQRRGLFEFNANFYRCAGNLSLQTTWEKIAFVGS